MGAVPLLLGVHGGWRKDKAIYWLGSVTYGSLYWTLVFKMVHVLAQLDILFGDIIFVIIVAL